MPSLFIYLFFILHFLEGAKELLFGFVFFKLHF